MAALLVFSVNTQADIHDVAPNDKKCWDGTTFCSLRAAIEEANANVLPDDTIQIYVPAGHYKLTLGQLVITAKNVFIDGVGSDKTILDGLQQTRIFDIAGGSTVMIRGVMIQNGKAGKSDDRVAGTHYHGGGIHNHGTLFLENSALSGNYAPGGVTACTGSCGGGLYNAGSAELVNVTVAYNSADASGGGIANGGNLDLHHVNLADNLAFTGGGLYNISSGKATLSATIVANNDGVNSANNCGWPNTGAPNPPSDGGNNLQHSLAASDPQSCGTTIQVADPGIDPVKNANGAAIYYRLYAWSPAIDKYTIDFYEPGCEGRSIDQRGIARPQDGNGDGVKSCDIGSYERQPTDP